MPAGDKWTLEETEAAFALYMALPTSRIKKDSPEVVALAESLGRSANSVHLKLWNIASHDPNRIALGKKGMPNASKFDLEVWTYYRDGGSEFVAEAAGKLDRLSKRVIETTIGFNLPVGEERKTLVAERVNQDYFRNTLLLNYDGKCCLSGVRNPKLLIASHIKPWKVADAKTERVNPANGLLLNALLDRAFDKGLMTVDLAYRVVFSPVLKKDPSYNVLFRPYEGKTIELPEHMPPAKEFLEYHNDVVFVRST